MGTIVKDINDAIEVRIAVVLPESWKELLYKLNVEKNSGNNSAERYGARPLAAISVPGVTNFVTMDQDFEIILMNRYVNHNDDIDQQTKTFDLYDKMDDIIKDLMHTKIGLPTILLVSDPKMDESENLDADKAVVLRSTLTIRYRRST